MGLRSSALMCQRLTDAIRLIFASDGFNVVNYLDDFGGCDTLDKAWLAYEKLKELLGDCGIEESVEKACPPDTRMIFLGITLDTVKLTLEIPRPKVKDVLLLLEKWLIKQFVCRKAVESLIGKLTFLSTCVPPGKVFVSRLLNFLRGLPKSGQVHVCPEVHKDIIWWKTYLPFFNGVSIMPLEPWPGVLSKGHFFHTVYPDFIRSQGHSINALELLTLVVALKLWGHLLEGRKEVLLCDNITSVHNGRTREVFLQQCLREICFHAALYNLKVRAKHIPGRDNRLPDLLSRWSLGDEHKDRFYELTQNQVLVEDVVPPALFQFSHNF